MVDNNRKDTKNEAPAASPAPTPAPAPAAAPEPPKETIKEVVKKSKAVTVAIWGALVWVLLRIVPQNKIPGALKGIGSMFWELASLGGMTAVESVKAAGRWSAKHGRRAFRFSACILCLAGALFILGNEFEARWPLGLGFILLAPLFILWWLAIKVARAAIYEATQAFGKSLNAFGRTMAALLRKVGVVIPDDTATDADRTKYIEAIDDYLSKIFLAMIGALTFLVVDFFKPGWETVTRLTPIAFLFILGGFYTAHLKIKSDLEIRVINWGRRLLMWALAAAFILPYTASVVAGKDFDRWLGDLLKDQGFGFTPVGIVVMAILVIVISWLWVAMTPEQVRLADGGAWENPKRRRRMALAVAGTILIPLAVIFLFWRGDITVAELKGERAKTGTEEKAGKTSPDAKAMGDKSEPAKATLQAAAESGSTPTGPTPQAFTGGGGAQATTRLDLPEPMPDSGQKPSRPTTAETPAPQPLPAQARPAKRDTKPRRYSNFLEATDALDQAGL